jgi:ethanolamine utilization protein EutQ (cupin superfamily)
MVVEGQLDIELSDRTVVLKPGNVFTAPKGVMRFPPPPRAGARAS